MTMWLLIDAPNLLYRAHYATGKKLDAGTTFGFLRYLSWLEGEFCTRRVAFCWDGWNLLRRKDYPNYKKAREDRLNAAGYEECVRHVEFVAECGRLYHNVLQDLGYANNFREQGYEADDLIASICLHSLKSKDEAVIASSDKDLYQLLSNRVTIWHPTGKRMFTKESLATLYFGLSPQQWSQVKAISGCRSDGVLGIPGVGDTTAAKFLRGLLPASSKKAQAIESNSGVWKRNLPLVRLPYEGCPRFDLAGATPDLRKWNSSVRSLNMKTLTRLR